ncbi:TPA: hypothetical protein RH266_004254 [Escherichia coli]|nr:hypothetical protein [Escherichia coli]HDV3906639.1 hypothetical protein [Escherichia coli]
MTHYDEKRAFEEANPDIFNQQEEERELRFEELLSRYVENCRKDGYYVTYNAQGDVRFNSELMKVVEAPARALHRGFKRYAEKLGYRGAYPKDSLSRVLYALEEGLTYAEHTFFEPGAAAFKTVDAARGMYARNTWKPFQESDAKPADGNPPNLEVFFQRTEQIYGKHADHWLDMVAFMVQYPGCRLPQFMYLVGGQGAGKGTYHTWYIMPLFAAGQALKTKDLPTGRFDLADYTTKEFVFFDDPVGSEKDRQQLKAILTETYLAVEPKYGRIHNSRLYFNTVLLCNPEQLFPVHEEDRRPYVVISPDDPSFNWPDYRDEVEIPELTRCGEVLDNPEQHGAYIDALHDYFMKRPVDFNKMMRPIKTADHLVVANMVSPVESAILDAADLFSVVGCSKLQEVIDYDKNRLPTHNTIGTVLKKHGWVEVRVRFNDREKPRAYYNPARFQDKPSQEVLRRAYNQEYYELEEVTDQTTEVQPVTPVVDDMQPLPAAVDVSDPLPPEDLQAAFENDGPDDDDNEDKSYMTYIPDEYMSEDFRSRLTPPKNVTQGFWMYVDGVKVWYDPTTGSDEKPVEIVPDDQLPACMCAPRDDLPPARGLSVDAANAPDYLVWNAVDDCWSSRSPVKLTGIV